MRWSRFFIPTLRDVPSEAEVASHKLLLRAGLIRQLSAGVYSHLPLARRTLLKIEAIVRQEMDKMGAQEFHLPALHPAELWKESGRWEVMGENMFRLRDRGGRDMCLGMTHEEVFTSLSRDEVRSYRELPQIWYQIQTKFRDELRPKSGLLRVRQFLMKDSYSFDLDQEGLDASYKLHEEAYRTIFDRCGLEYLVVEATSGAMGGSESQEFMVRTDAGEDYVVTCSCGYAANRDRAQSRVESEQDPESDESPQEVHTPGRKTIQEVSEFLDIPESRQIKSLVYMVEGQAHLILLRGDHQLNEAKLGSQVGTENFRPAHPEEIVEAFGADPGSLGPVGVRDMPIWADQALQGRRDLVCGANKDDHHLLHVSPGRDFEVPFVELRQIESGDACSSCGEPLEVAKALEIGHIFKLGRKYSELMDATVLDQVGREVPVTMGSYGIGVERIMVAAVELYHDDKGIVWPRNIAPFQAVVTVVRVSDSEQMKAAEGFCEVLEEKGVDCLLDDRDERPGVKFKDAELIGIPVRITVGNKLREGKVEVFSRKEAAVVEVVAGEAVERALEILQTYPI